MLENIPAGVGNALIAIVAIALFVAFWKSTAGAKSSDTVLIRFVLGLLLLPFVLAGVLGVIGIGPEPGKEVARRAPSSQVEKARPPASAQAPASAPAPASTPGSAQRTAAAPPAKAPAPTPPPTSAPTAPPAAAPAPPPMAAPAPPPPPAAPRPSETAPDRTAAAPPQPAAPPVEARPRSQEGDGAAPRAAAPPPPAPAPVPAPAPEVSAPPAAAPPREEAAATPPPAAAPPAVASEPTAAETKEPWDVVPVYYGTDRASEGKAERPQYGSDRARRLQLGRALVTVPKVHEIPNVERPWVYRLPFTRIVIYEEKEDPARHFTLKELKAMTAEELSRLVRDRLAASKDFKDHALLFVHGFNTTFEASLFRTAQIAYDLKFDGAPFVYSWPSKGAIGFQDYSYDRESAGQAEPYLREMVDFIAKETGAKTISIIAHSMGNQVLLPVLRDLKRTAPAGVTISQIILAAPDVDRDTFEFLAKEISGVGQGITMLAASNDRALTASRRFWGGVPRAGDVSEQGPIVVPGIDTIDVTAVSTEMLSLNHSGYAQKEALLEDIRRLLQTGTRPPDKRLETLEKVTTPKGDFWRYPTK